MKDFLGIRIKNHPSKEEIAYIGTYYIFHNKIYRVLRLKTYQKLDGKYCEFQSVEVNRNKIWGHTLSMDNFKDRLYFLGKDEVIEHYSMKQKD